MYRTDRYEHQRRSPYAEEHVRGLPRIEVGEENWPPAEPDLVLRDAGRLSRIDLSVTTEQLALWLPHPVMRRVDILRVKHAPFDGDPYDPQIWDKAIRQLAEWPELGRLEELNVWLCGGYLRPEESASYHLAEELLAPRVNVTYDH